MSPAGFETLHPPMHILRNLGGQFSRLIKRVAAFCEPAVFAVRRWQRQQVLDASEAERLDRIRNPSKYLGKS
jgi:hypothetical protein